MFDNDCFETALSMIRNFAKGKLANDEKWSVPHHSVESMKKSILLYRKISPFQKKMFKKEAYLKSKASQLIWELVVLLVPSKFLGWFFLRAGYIQSKQASKQTYSLATLILSYFYTWTEIYEIFLKSMKSCLVKRIGSHYCKQPCCDLVAKTLTLNW